MADFVISLMLPVVTDCYGSASVGSYEPAPQRTSAVRSRVAALARPLTARSEMALRPMDLSREPASLVFATERATPITTWKRAHRYPDGRCGCPGPERQVSASACADHSHTVGM
jgi:hypothetical protein